MNHSLKILPIVVLLFSSLLFPQKRILVLGWNVESGDNNPSTIGRQLQLLEGYDLAGLTEVEEMNAELYASAFAYGEGAYGEDRTFDYALGATGRSDRMMLLWDSARFEQVGAAIEIDSLNEGYHRAPLYIQLKLKGTDIGFLFMVNHLARANADLRQRQAQGLAAWSKKQTLPIIAVGDYNFDYNIDDGVGNKAFDIFLHDNALSWIRPQKLVKTSLHPRYNGILDFFFLAHKPENWRVSSTILFDDKTMPDNYESSDHRPVEGLIYIE